MKNLKISSILFLGLMVFSVYGCEKEEIIKENELPSSIRSYLETHFSSCNTTKIVKEKESNELSYDITLDCGINIEFNGSNQVTDIDGTSQLPNTVIPSNILDYTSTNYSNDFIIGWELEGNNQQVEMNTNVVLEFDSNGSFLRIID